MQTLGRVPQSPSRCLTPEEALSYVLSSGSRDTSSDRSPSSALDPKVIQEHLDECDSCRVVLAEAVRASIGTDGATSAPFRTLHDGQSLLGRYEIRRFIARRRRLRASRVFRFFVTLGFS